VLFVVICLANQTGIDLQEAFDLAMDKRTQRDRERHASNPKLQS
jgi:NTP pyrophosphatase (non-canonical NTP hydrolase)